MQGPTNRRIPLRLNKAPLLEAIWELRFDGDPAAGGALPGILFEKLKTAKRDIKIETLPLASIPRATRDGQEQFRYAPTSVLRYDNFAIFTSDRSAALSVVRPYPGWAKYGKEILELSKLLLASKMIKTLEQCTLKYIDFFDCGPDDVFKKLQLTIQVGDLKLDPSELRLQLKVQKNDFRGIIQVMNPATAIVEGRPTSGLVTDVQVTWQKPVKGDFWKEFPNKLTKAKATCHELFFGLLTNDTIVAHQPIYKG